MIQLYIYILFHLLLYYGLSEDIEYNSLCYTIRPCCLSFIYICVCVCVCIYIYIVCIEAPKWFLSLNVQFPGKEHVGGSTGLHNICWLGWVETLINSFVKFLPSRDGNCFSTP